LVPISQKRLAVWCKNRYNRSLFRSRLRRRVRRLRSLLMRVPRQKIFRS